MSKHLHGPDLAVPIARFHRSGLGLGAFGPVCGSVGGCLVPRIFVSASRSMVDTAVARAMVAGSAPVESVARRIDSGLQLLDDVSDVLDFGKIFFQSVDFGDDSAHPGDFIVRILDGTVGPATVGLHRSFGGIF